MRSARQRRENSRRIRLRRLALEIGALLLASAPFAMLAVAQNSGSDVPVDYLAGKVNDPVAGLIADVNRGKTELAYDSKYGYLKSVLAALHISGSSQVLVFSKTSFQAPYISPVNPRALYFSDRAYVGWIPGAPYMELVGVDPKLGPVFYTLQNRSDAKIRIERKTYDCLECHDTPLTHGVPGMMARSVYPGPDGTPRLEAGSFETTATSPIMERWGGWYVTGTMGAQRHMGNVVARGDEENPVLDTEKGANVTDLHRFFDADDYLTPNSDVVALMVLEQQMTIQNLIVKAAYDTRTALQYADVLRSAKWDESEVRHSLEERLSYSCEPLVRALLGVGEPTFISPIRGVGTFAADFSKSAPADTSGRRLSELDLKNRILKYPCSPMVYSSAFAALPAMARKHVTDRIRAVLESSDSSQPSYKLNPSTAKVALEILNQTLPGFARGH